jgi:hypothetical protein
MRKSYLHYYITGFVGLIVIGFFATLVFQAMKIYTIVQEEGENNAISIVSEPLPAPQIAELLLRQQLDILKRRTYVSRIEDYQITGIKIVEETADHFIFEVQYNVKTSDPNTTWKNGSHTEKDGRIYVERIYRVNRVDNTYHMHIAYPEDAMYSK